MCVSAGMSCTRTQLTQRPSQGLRAAGRGACVRTHAVASPVSVESVPVPGKEITKDDIGIRATQQELDKYLSSYVSSPVERVKYISPEHISVRSFVVHAPSQCLLPDLRLAVRERREAWQLMLLI